jgi:hypothetical protein
MRRVGMLGASAGGEARARSLSSARKRAIAKKAAAARWGKKAGKGIEDARMVGEKGESPLKPKTKPAATKRNTKAKTKPAAKK